MTDDKLRNPRSAHLFVLHLSFVICHRNEPRASFAVYVFAVPDKQITPCWFLTVVASVQIGLSSRTAVTSIPAGDHISDVHRFNELPFHAEEDGAGTRQILRHNRV